jgi:hypothetical protein
MLQQKWKQQEYNTIQYKTIQTKYQYQKLQLFFYLEYSTATTTNSIHSLNVKFISKCSPTHHSENILAATMYDCHVFQHFYDFLTHTVLSTIIIIISTSEFW